MLRTIFEEFLAIFVDDIRFAVSIIAWIAIAGLALPLMVNPTWQGLLLGLGLLIILAESAWRRARA